MGNGYNHQFQYQQNLSNFQKSTFLPMLCSSRTSIKDVVALQPRLKDRSASFSNDPLSPKIGCMGQVKRNSSSSSNSIIAFPTTTRSHNNNTKHALTNISNDVKYFKLRRLFSAKNIIATDNDSRSCRRRRRRREVTTEREVCINNIAEMDPPLPVIRKPAVGDHEGDESKSKNVNNLWKRRSNGGALKTLELQHIQIPRHQLEIQTV